MAFHQTPFDHIGVWSPPMRLIPFLQGTCLVLIEASRFAASSLLIVLGLPLFAFLFLAGWDMGPLFAQLANQIGRAHVCTPVPTSHLVCSLALEKNKHQTISTTNN